MITAVEQVHECHSEFSPHESPESIAERSYRAGAKAVLIRESKERHGKACCGVCMVQAKRLVLGRIVPRSLGGDDSAGNLTLLCESCNRMHAGLSPSDWSDRLRDMASRVDALQDRRKAAEAVRQPKAVGAGENLPASHNGQKPMHPDTRAYLESLAGHPVGFEIDFSEWEAMKPKEREIVILGLEDRGLILTRGVRALEISNPVVPAPAIEITSITPQFEFCVGLNHELRLPFADEITFCLAMAADEAEAWNKLRAFLAALQKQPLNLEPSSEEGEAIAA